MRKINPWNRPELAELWQIAEEYFIDATNRPFSVAEVFLKTGLDRQTSLKWIRNGNNEEKAFIWFVLYTVLADLEKGDKINSVNASLVPKIIERYFSFEEEAGEDDLKIEVVVDHGQSV